MYFINRFLSLNIALLIFLLPFASDSYSANTQFSPVLSVSGEYTDNYFRTDSDKDDEYFTIFGADFSFGIIDKKGKLFFDWAPEYKDHNEFDENDFWRHSLGIDGSYQVTKKTSLSFSEDFVRDNNQSVRNNDFNEHNTNDTIFGVVHQFGPRDSLGINYTYSFDLYDDPNRDEYKRHNPTVFLGYWFSPKWGFDANLSYSKTMYDFAVNEPETVSGDIRLLHMINKHLDVYAKYAQSYTDQTIGSYDVFHPSLGFNWRPTDDSGITLGIGVLFQDWDIPGDYDKERFFLDLDMYKHFDFTRKSRLSILGESGYGDVDPKAASLGFNIYGEAGLRYTYQLMKKLSSNIRGSYRVNEYTDPVFDRTDNSLDLGAGLVWTPLKWLSINLSYSFRDFDTDALGREDYQENVGTLTVRFIPSQPVKFSGSDPRSSLENQVFTPR